MKLTITSFPGQNFSPTIPRILVNYLAFPMSLAKLPDISRFSRQVVTLNDCNPGILNPAIPAVFANPKSRDWKHPMPGFRDYKKNCHNCTFLTVI